MARSWIMEHRISHDLTQEQARKAVRRAVETYTERFAKYVTETKWVNDDEVHVAFNAKGAKLAGQLKLVPNAIVIDMDVPLLLRPFKGKAVEVVEEQVQKWVQRARSGEI
jgi:hypothetical protein